jgi:hypothetical protein
MTEHDADQDVFRRHATSVNVPPRLSSLGRMNTLASWAQHLARALLQEPLPRRWAHVRGVAARARSLAPVLGADADLLEAAAWLHDIGYAPGLAVTDLHALDGARYLRDVQHAVVMLCRLVAHHFCAVIEAEERGLRDVLSLEFEQAPQVLSSMLTFCDMTTSPDGELVPVEMRLAEIHRRYGSGHLVSRSIHRATPTILRAVDQVSRQLAREDLVHDLGAGGDDRPQLAAVHHLRGAGAGMPDEARDFLHRDAGARHEADE